EHRRRLQRSGVDVVRLEPEPAHLTPMARERASGVALLEVDHLHTQADDTAEAADVACWTSGACQALEGAHRRTWGRVRLVLRLLELLGGELPAKKRPAVVVAARERARRDRTEVRVR